MQDNNADERTRTQYRAREELYVKTKKEYEEANQQYYRATKQASEAIDELIALRSAKGCHTIEGRKKRLEACNKVYVRELELAQSKWYRDVLATDVQMLREMCKEMEQNA